MLACWDQHLAVSAAVCMALDSRTMHRQGITVDFSLCPHFLLEVTLTLMTLVYCLFVFTGSGESDAYCWAEATHAAEGFPRHLKLHRDCKAPASPSFLPPCLPPLLPSMTTPQCSHTDSSFWRSLIASFFSPPLIPIMLQGHRMARLYLPFLLSSSPHLHVLAQSITFTVVTLDAAV